MSDEKTQQGAFRAEVLRMVAMEMAVGPRPRSDAPMPEVCEMAIRYLTDAIVSIATLNTEPVQILDRVVAMIDTADLRRKKP